MTPKRIKFTQRIGGLAKIEGTAAAGKAAIELELAMTESIDGPVRGVLKRSIAYAHLQDVQYSRRLLRAPVLRFIAGSLEAFGSIPGATGFEYSVNPLTTKAECLWFVTEAQLAIAEATTQRFTRQIEQSLGHERE
jgi:hypothetical protein